MKKLFKLLICLFILISVTSCGLFSEGEAEPGFLDESVLSDYRLADFPIPEGEIRHSQNKAYCTMTDEEYASYCAEVVTYLLAKEDIYHKGYHYETGCTGGIFYLPEYRFSKLDESTDATVGWFIFSLTEELHTADGYREVYSNGVFVKVMRKDGSRGSFDYDVVIEIDEAHFSVKGVAEHDEHTFEYIGNDYTHQKVYTCGCPTPDIAEMHLDGDGDNYCDLCSVEHKHIFSKWYYNDEYHWCVGNCLWDACDDLSTYAEHYNYDADLFCDACGYTMPIQPEQYEFSSLSGVEWIDGISAADVAEIRMISEASGVAPGSYRYIEVSENASTVERILEEYSDTYAVPYTDEYPFVPGGSVFTVEIVLNDGTKLSYSLNDEIYTDNGGKYYTVYNIPTFHYVPEYTSRYGFITYNGYGAVMADGDDGELCYVCDIPMDELEFVVLDYSLPTGVTDYSRIVKAEFGELMFIENDIFYIKGELTGNYYRLVGKNLDELIAEATAEKYSLVMTDAEWLFEDIKDSYAAGEVVKVRIKMALDLGYLFIVNGEKINNCIDRYGLYWEFSFTMPECDTVISFKTYDGFLPDENYALLIETFWLKEPRSDHVRIANYYGEYASGAIVAMIDSANYTEALWAEEIDGVSIHYGNGNRILALYDGEFYTLSRAYELGYLTLEDIGDINEKHREFCPYLYLCE